jgi:hypothetical protein
MGIALCKRMRCAKAATVSADGDVLSGRSVFVLKLATRVNEAIIFRVAVMVTSFRRARCLPRPADMLEKQLDADVVCNDAWTLLRIQQT